MSILGAMLVLVAVVLVHELGHFVAARLCGIEVERFSIGFGPVLLRWRALGTEWVVSPILLGGYVKLPALERAARWKRAFVAASGPGANHLAAMALVTMLGLSQGLSLVQGLKASVIILWQVAAETLSVMAALLHGGHGAVMGPVGIVADLSHSATPFAWMVGAIGLSLAVGLFNLLPMPPLDGGELVLIGLEAVRGKRLGRSATVAKVTGAVALLALLAGTLVADLRALRPSAVPAPGDKVVHVEGRSSARTPEVRR